MPRAGRPRAFPIKKVIGFDREMMVAIDGWRRRQPDLPTVSEAIRRLIDQSLATGTAKATHVSDSPARATDTLPKSKADQIAALRKATAKP